MVYHELIELFIFKIPKYIRDKATKSEINLAFIYI